VYREKRYLVPFSDTKVRQTLKAAEGNVRKAAEALDVALSSFYARLKAMRENVPGKAKPGKKKTAVSVKKTPVKKAAAPAKKAAKKKTAAPVKKKAAKKKR